MKRRVSGTGSIFKDKRGFWIAEFITPEGKKKRKASKRQSVVKDWLEINLSHVREGTYIEDSKLTVDQFFDQFMNNIAPVTLRPKTIESYKWVINHARPEIGSIRLSALKPTHLQSLYSRKLEIGLSKLSVIKIHNVLQSILNHAVKFELIVRNPAIAVSPPEAEDKPLQTLSVVQLQMLLDALKDHRWYPIYCIAIGCGLREGEILGLRKQDVMLDEGILKVEQTVVTIRGKLTIGTPKSGASKRTVGLPDFVISALQEPWNDTKADQLIFRTKNNTPISQRNLLRHFHTTLDQMGIPRVRFHSLRHSFITMLLAKNTPPRDVQAIAGHSSFGVTMSIYGHLMPGYHHDAARKLDGLV